MRTNSIVYGSMISVTEISRFSFIIISVALDQFDSIAMIHSPVARLNEVSVSVPIVDAYLS